MNNRLKTSSDQYFRVGAFGRGGRGGGGDRFAPYRMGGPGGPNQKDGNRGAGMGPRFPNSFQNNRMRQQPQQSLPKITKFNSGSAGFGPAGAPSGAPPVSSLRSVNLVSSAPLTASSFGQPQVAVAAAPATTPSAPQAGSSVWGHWGSTPQAATPSPAAPSSSPWGVVAAVTPAAPTAVPQQPQPGSSVWGTWGTLAYPAATQAVSSQPASVSVAPTYTYPAGAIAAALPAAAGYAATPAAVYGAYAGYGATPVAAVAANPAAYANYAQLAQAVVPTGQAVAAAAPVVQAAATLAYAYPQAPAGFTYTFPSYATQG